MDKEAEYSFYLTLEAIVTDETVDKPIDKLLEHEKFQGRGKSICDSLARRFKLDGDEIYQQACLKVWKNRRAINPTNVSNENDFFNWFRMVARTVCCSEWRKERKHKRHLDTRAVEEFPVADHRVNLDAEQLLKEFLESSERLPDEKRLAIDLWLQGYSTRAISDVLEQEGISYTHVAISIWIDKAIKNFQNGKPLVISRAIARKKFR